MCPLASFWSLWELLFWVGFLLKSHRIALIWMVLMVPPFPWGVLTLSAALAMGGIFPHVLTVHGFFPPNPPGSQITHPPVCPYLGWVSPHPSLQQEIGAI